MIEKNYEYLKNQLLFTGFGEGHNEKLKMQMEKGPAEFVLTHKAAIGKDEAVATLHFKKSDSSDMYFFNKYNMQLKKEGEDVAMKQTIYLRNKEDNISFKEAYNLMNERSVFKEKVTKEGEKYQTWIKLDFKDADNAGNFKVKSQNFGYDLEKALSRYPITELKDVDLKQQIVGSLQRGNRQEVTLEVEGKASKMFIEANPASGMNHGLKVYDGQMQRVQQMGKGQERGVTTMQQQSEKNKLKGDGEDAPGERTNSKKLKGQRIH
jgi:hypothetical protein